MRPIQEKEGRHYDVDRLTERNSNKGDGKRAWHWGFFVAANQCSDGLDLTVNPIASRVRVNGLALWTNKRDKECFHRGLTMS